MMTIIRMMTGITQVDTYLTTPIFDIRVSNFLIISDGWHTYFKFDISKHIKLEDQDTITAAYLVPFSADSKQMTNRMVTLTIDFLMYYSDKKNLITINKRFYYP